MTRPNRSRGRATRNAGPPSERPAPKQGQPAGARQGKPMVQNSARTQRPDKRREFDPTERLGTPPKAPFKGLRVVALGGIGEIGRNMTVFEHQAKCSSSTAACSFPRTSSPAST